LPLLIAWGEQKSSQPVFSGKTGAPAGFSLV